MPSQQSRASGAGASAAGAPGPVAPEFRPAWWCPGRHLQTIWGRFVRRRAGVPTSSVRWTTPDDDFLDIDLMEGRSGSPRLLVLHGLEGCSRSKYSLGLLALARRRGWHGAALNFRSCGGTLNDGPCLYHSGATGDLDWMIERLIRIDPGGVILTVGVSLGANVLLKWLAESGGEAPAQVRAAAAISPPYDLAAGAAALSEGMGRLYTRFFLRSLKAKALAKARQHPGLLDERAIRRARTWREYDDAVTAPLHGFRSADEYWELSSCGPHLGRIRRPTLLIGSRDDPFMPSRAQPEAPVGRSDWLYGAFSDRGGHVGFVSGRWPWRARYWAEHRAIDFLAGFVDARPPAHRPQGMVREAR